MASESTVGGEKVEWELALYDRFTLLELGPMLFAVFFAFFKSWVLFSVASLAAILLMRRLLPQLRRTGPPAYRVSVSRNFVEWLTAGKPTLVDLRLVKRVYIQDGSDSGKTIFLESNDGVDYRIHDHPSGVVDKVAVQLELRISGK